MKLEGRAALVTGAGHRVGRELAVALGAQGMNVAVHFNSSREEADETVRLIAAAGGKGQALQADLADARGPSQVVRDAHRALGALHVVVNSAAVMTRHPFADITVADWDATMALNLRAPFFVCQAAAGVMTDGGAIVNIADLAAFESWPAYLHHGISKNGIVKMTQSLARVLAPSIRVNAIAPGAVLLPDDWSDVVGERLSDTTPMRRLGDPADVVGAMLYLLQADFVTGETIIVDGGRHIRK